MNHIHKQVIDQAVKNFSAMRAKFTIVAEDGTKFTNVEKVVAASRKKRVQLVPMGTYLILYQPVMSQMSPGDLREIVVPDGIDIESARSSACAWATRNWGMKTYTTYVTGRVIQVMRNPPPTSATVVPVTAG